MGFPPTFKATVLDEGAGGFVVVVYIYPSDGVDDRVWAAGFGH